MKVLVGTFNQEKALVGAFSVIVLPVVEPMDRFTALLRKFGYDPEDEKPVYGVPDGEVANNTHQIHQKKQFWEDKAKELLSEMDKKKDKKDLF